MKFKSYIEWHMYHKILNSYSSQGYVIEEAEKLAERKTQSNKIQSIIKSYENKRDRENKADRERAKMNNYVVLTFVIVVFLAICIKLVISEETNWFDEE